MLGKHYVISSLFDNNITIENSILRLLLRGRATRPRQVRQGISSPRGATTAGETGPPDGFSVYFLLNLIIGRIRVGTNATATMYNNDGEIIYQ